MPPLPRWEAPEPDAPAPQAAAREAAAREAAGKPRTPTRRVSEAGLAARQESLALGGWRFPPLSLLRPAPPRGTTGGPSEDTLVANARLCRRRGYGKRNDANPDPGNGHADPRNEFDVDHQKSLPTLVLVSMKMRSVISSADKMPVPIGIGRRATVS